MLFIKENKIDDLVFVLGGDNSIDFQKKINRKMKSIDGYSANIIHTGYVEDGDMAHLYSGAHMFVYPSLYEGFGMPILEALNCGCPVICSNTSSMPEVVGDCGIMIDPKNAKQLKDAFKKLYYDETLRAKLSQKSLKRAKLFTWEKATHIIVNKFLATLDINKP